MRWGLNCLNGDAETHHLCLAKLLWKALKERDSQWTTKLLLFLQHTCLSSRTLSASILCVLHHWVIRTQGWWMEAERNSFYASSQACMSQTCSPTAINLVLWPLKPVSNNATALQTEEEISMRGRGSRRGNQREKRKTSCSRWHQMYLRGSSRGSAERAASRYERLQTGSERRGGGESARGGWANARGRKERITSSSTWFDLIYVTTLKT